MNEAIGNSMIFQIIITIVCIAIGIVFFSLGYSKTYKTKNKVIDIIERGNGFPGKDNIVAAKIDEYFKDVGYSSFTEDNSKCPNLDGISNINEPLRAYFYCVYPHVTSKGIYYTVRVYMSYNLPIIGDIIKLRYSLRGDTAIILDL